MAFWLMKSEPGAYGWDDLCKDGRTHWDGVRNYQARNNLMAMKIDDLSLFYHSVNEKRVMGVTRVVKEYYPDPTDQKGQFGMVDIIPVAPFHKPVTLAQIKAVQTLGDIALIRQSRLSVMSIAPDHWDIMCAMGGYVPS